MINDQVILAVPLLMACAFALTMVFVTCEEAFSKRKDDI